MSATYVIFIFNPTTGARVAIIDNALELTYVKRVNEAGVFSFAVNRSHKDIGFLVDKALVEIWRSDLDGGIAPYCDFYGLIRKRQTRGLPVNRVTVSGVGQMALLGWRTVNFRKAVANRTIFTSAKAETIMKTLVTYNATASATVVNNRISDGTWPDRTITVQADAAGGSTRDWECEQRNLLVTLKDLSRVGGGDFDLVKTGAMTWDFRFYAGQLGADRTASVKIGEDFGNMTNAELTEDWTNEKSVAIVGGQGEKADRVYVTVLGTNYTTSNKVEMFVNGSNYTQTGALTSIGLAALYQ